MRAAPEAPPRRRRWAPCRPRRPTRLRACAALRTGLSLDAFYLVLSRVVVTMFGVPERRLPGSVEGVQFVASGQAEVDPAQSGGGPRGTCRVAWDSPRTAARGSGGPAQHPDQRAVSAVFPLGQSGHVLGLYDLVGNAASMTRTATEAHLLRSSSDNRSRITACTSRCTEKPSGRALIREYRRNAPMANLNSSLFPHRSASDFGRYLKPFCKRSRGMFSGPRNAKKLSISAAAGEMSSTRRNEISQVVATDAG